MLQALLASGYSQGNYEQARQVTYRLLEVYGITNFYAIPVRLVFLSLLENLTNVIVFSMVLSCRLV